MAGVALTLPYWLLHLFDWEEGASLAFLAVPLLVAVSLIPLLAVTQQDQWLRRCMLAGLGMKIASACIYMLIGTRLWGWSIDVYGYVNEGWKWANQVNTIGEVVVLRPFYATNFVTMLTGAMELVVGRSFAILAVIYSLAGYWGQYFFYSAFCSAFPKANRKFAAVLMFLVPSMVYWTAMVGKDALLCLGTGLATYGFIQMSSRLNLTGLFTFISGVAIDFLVRPHIGAVAAMAATVALLLGRNIKGTIGAATRLILIPAVLAFTVFIAGRASGEWGVGNVEQGLARQERAMNDSNYGGSAFAQSDSMLVRLALAPTLLFRPMPWEVRSWQAALASLEGTWMFILCWQRRRSLFKLLANMRQNPLLVYSVLFIFMFVFGLAPGISNFGLLVRQRVMILPFSFVLIVLGTVPRQVFSTFGSVGIPLRHRR